MAILLALIINYTIGFGVLLLYGVITYYNLKLKELVASEIERLKSFIPTEQTATQQNELAE